MKSNIGAAHPIQIKISWSPIKNIMTAAPTIQTKGLVPKTILRMPTRGQMNVKIIRRKEFFMMRTVSRGNGFPGKASTKICAKMTDV